jgi:hypothetical protein
VGGGHFHPFFHFAAAGKGVKSKIKNGKLSKFLKENIEEKVVNLITGLFPFLHFPLINSTSPLEKRRPIKIRPFYHRTLLRESSRKTLKEMPLLSPVQEDHS